MRRVMGMATAFVGMVFALHIHAADKPNIVIILNDDLGYTDVGCFGSEKNPTPRIDRLAKEGRRFTDFYVASSVCSASRAALMPGRYPEDVGVRGVFFPNRLQCCGWRRYCRD